MNDYNRSINNSMGFMLLALSLYLVPGCIASAIKASSAFYNQVILEQHDIRYRIRVTPRMFHHIESNRDIRNVAALRKVAVPSTIQKELV